MTIVRRSSNPTSHVATLRPQPHRLDIDDAEAIFPYPNVRLWSEKTVWMARYLFVWRLHGQAGQLLGVQRARESYGPGNY